jgi:hypothetical protein
MKKRLSFLVAAMAATVAAPALAQDPGKMFMINAVTPGVVSFSGEGTATFNNSSSTSNAFSVGSNTSFGVNASAASTNDYMVDANALLQLSGESQLKQVLGTSSSAANLSEVATSALAAASASATSQADTEFGGTFSDYVAKNGGSQAEINSASSAAGLVKDSNSNFTGTIQTESAWEQEKSGRISELTQSNYATTNSEATQSSANEASGSGIISGTFYTANNSSSSIGASAGVIDNITNQSAERADTEYGEGYSDYTTKFEQIAGGTIASGAKIDTDVKRSLADAAGLKYDANDGTGFSNTEWTTEKSSFESSETASLTNQAASNGTASSDSTAEVTVTGVGSNAELNASDASAFNVDIATRVRTAMPETNGTANGAAGGNLSTASFANQSNTQSASAFMQAFGSDSVQLLSNSDGELTGARVTGRLAVDINAVQGGTPDSASPTGQAVMIGGNTLYANNAGDTETVGTAAGADVATPTAGYSPVYVGGTGGADNLKITVAGN